MTHRILLALLHITEWWLAIGAVVGIAVDIWALRTQRTTWRVRDYAIVFAGSLIAWPAVVGIGYAARRGHASRPNGWSGGAR